MSEKTELHAIFKGVVQGVGFRWTVLDYAEEYQLTGTVKNLSNGTVEVFAQGSKASLEAFVESVRQDKGAAKISVVECRYHQPNETYHSFRIIH